MTMSLIHQIELAERGLTTPDLTDPRFVADEHRSLRESFGRLLRSGAKSGLRLADRLDPAYHAA